MRLADLAPITSIVVLPKKNLNYISSLPTPVIAVTYMAVAAVLFVAMHTIVRGMSGQLHPFEIAFFRAFLGLFVLFPFILKDNFSMNTNR